MENFIIGAILGIAAFLLLVYIIGKTIDEKYKKEFGEDFETRPKSEDIKLHHNVTICIKDNDMYTAQHVDDDGGTIAFMTFYPNNIKYADFYYSLFENKQVITIDYNHLIYKAIITEIKLVDINTLRIYYNILK